MRKFTKDQAVCSLEFQETFKTELQPLLFKINNDGCSNLLFLNRWVILSLLSLADSSIDLANELWLDVSSFSFSALHTIEKFDRDELSYMREVYEIFFPHISSSMIPAFYDKYASVECAGEHYGSRFSRLNRSAYILAKWSDQYEGEVNRDTAELRPGVVLYYVRQTVKIDDVCARFASNGSNTTPTASIVARLALLRKFGAQTCLTALVLFVFAHSKNRWKVPTRL